MNAKDFELALKEFAEKTIPEEHVRLMKKVTLDLLGRVTEKTPVDTGRLRANWMTGINAPDRTETDSTTDNAIARAIDKLSSLEFGETVHLSNNLPYAAKVEYGGYSKPGQGKTVDGFSVQAPQGMLGVSVEEVKAFLKPDDKEV